MEKLHKLEKEYRSLEEDLIEKELLVINQENEIKKKSNEL
jgi:hypothetical protein